MRIAAAASLIVACAGAPSAPAGRLDAEHASVGLLSSDCSGVLVAPQLVLTAAHCASDARLVTFFDGGWVRAAVVDGCHAHPQAMAESGPCDAIDPWQTVPEHDLAMLHLAEPMSGSVTPSPVLLDAPNGWDPQRVLLIGWHRHPAVVGPARRYAGENVVADVQGPMLHTLPLAPGGFRTEVGASGGPALARRGRDEWVIGILFGGTYPDSPDSLYVATFHPDNARWIAHAMQ